VEEANNYGLPNSLKVYKNQLPLENPVSELDFDTELLSHFEFANNDLDYLVGAISKCVGLYQIDSKSGQVVEIQKTEGDFHEKDPEVAKTKWSQDNKLIVSGGEDGVMRIFKVKFSAPNQISGFELSDEFGAHSQGINDV
jgi:WD40 repeat protein